MSEQEKIIPGKVVVRLPEGTDGTTELQISHDGTNAVIDSKLGITRFTTGITVAGTTILSSGLNGILNTTNGTVSGSAGLNDLTDVALDGTLVTGQVLKYNGTSWINDTDAGENSLAGLTDVTITTATLGDVLHYNGTVWVNNQTGATSGVQPYDEDLNTIAGLGQGTNNVIKSDGTVWTSDTLDLTELGDVVVNTPAPNQVLSYNGTNWINAEAPAGGDTLDTYFNKGNTAFYRVNLDGTDLTNVFTYSGTGAVAITSIMISNVDGTSDFEVDAVINQSSVDYYLGKSIPVLANTSLEILRRPKVLIENDLIKLKSNGTDGLQAFITIAPYEEDTSLWNAFHLLNNTDPNIVYTETNGSGSMIESILLANVDDGTFGVQLSVIINDGTNDTHLTYLMNIPQKASVELCEGPKFIPNGGTIKVQASDASRCMVSVSGRTIET